MKKLLYAFPIVVLLAAGCNSATTRPTNQIESTQQTQTTPTQQQQVTQNPTPTTTADITANWQVYNKYGITFKYPTDWVVKDSSSVQTGLRIFLQPKQYSDEVNPTGLSIVNAAQTDLSQAKNKRSFDINDKRNTNFVENVISIYFIQDSKTYLSNCTASVDVCNYIIETFK